MDIAYREDTDIEDRTIDSHVKRIRKKFKKVDPDFSAIETRQLGYDHYPYHPFICERLVSVWLQFNPQYSFEHIF